MKTNTIQLPIAPTRQLALAIVDQLPNKEYSLFLSDIRLRSRDRALASLRRFRSAVRKRGLSHRDFIQALKETRAQKAGRRTHCRH